MVVLIVIVPGVKLVVRRIRADGSGAVDVMVMVYRTVVADVTGVGGTQSCACRQVGDSGERSRS